MSKPWLLACVVAAAAGASSAAHAAQVRGRVTDRNKPVAGVVVSAIPYETPFEEARRDARHEADPAALASATSAVDGGFVLTLPPSAAPAGFRLALSGSSVTLARLDRVLDSARDEDVGDLRVSRAQALAGRVVDPKGGPVIGATVSLFAGTFVASRPVTAVTGADGSFRFSQASDAGNRLRVEAPGFVVLERTGVNSGPMAKPLVLTIGASVEGTVVMADKRAPAAGALVRFEGVASTRWTETRRDGGFTLEGVAGRGSIVAEAGSRGHGSVLFQAGDKPTIALVPPAALRGRVVDAATGAPIPGVAMTAVSAAGAAFTARTDARGAYDITALSAGSYTLSADEPRYVPWSREHVTVVAGGSPAVDAALVRAGTLTGRVLDPDGRPIDGASVRITLNGRGSFEAFMQAAQGKGLVRTGPDGSFKATRLQPGTRQSLTVSHDEFESRTLGGVDIAPGATRSVTVTLPRGRAVRGVVKDDDGQPVAGAQVQLMQAIGFRSRGGAMSMMMAGGPGAREPLETGADGRFEVKGLLAGDYRLSVSKRGYASESVDPLKVSETSAAQPIEVVLHAGVSVSGFVHTRAGAGVAGYRVMARPAESGGRGFGGAASDSPTGPDGAFQVEGLRANEAYDLMAVRDGGGSEPRSTRITTPAEGVEIVTDGTGRIRGTVMDADGHPLPDFQVSYATPPGNGPRMFFSFGGNAPAGSDRSPLTVHADDGSFVLDDVPAGRWNVDALAKGFQPGTAANVEVAEGDAGEAVEIRLARGSTIRGQVVENRSGRAVAGASVEAQAAQGRTFSFGMDSPPKPNATSTDADGRFEIAGLPPGTYSVVATHPDWTEASASIDLKDQPASVDLRMGQGGSVTGVVLSGGRGVGSASVALVPAGGGMPFGMAGRSAVTDDAGRFSFDRLTAGRYSLTAELRGQSSPPVEAVVATPDATQDVSLTLAAGTLIRGVVSGLGESERSGLFVNASGPEDFFATARTAPDGSFEIAGAPVGVVSLRATVGSFGQGSRSAQASVTVAEGQSEAAAEISFEGGFRLEGHVTRGGRPVTDAMVFAGADGGPGMSSSGRTDDAGAYAIDGLKEGVYSLSATSTSGGQAEAKVQVKGDTTADLEIPSARIAGRVVEAVSGRPLADATISTDGGDHGFFMNLKSDSSGSFAVEGLEPKPYRLTIRKPAYQTEVREVTPSESDEVTIEMRRGEGMGIEARDGVYGMALRGISVRILDATGTVFSGPVSLDSDGRGEIPSLAPGTYQLRAASDGYAPLSLPPVTVPSSPISLTLTPGGSLEIQVGAQTLARSNPSGRILHADQTVYLPWIYSDDGIVRLKGPSRRIDNVVPGRYFFVADDGTRREFQVQEGGSATVVLP